MIDAAKLPATIRAKFDIPVADGSRSPGIRSSEIVSIARKNVLIAIPCTIIGTIRSQVLAVVAVGGAAGACLRAGLTDAFPAAGGEIPWTTFAINVVGSFLLALLPVLAVVRRRPLLPPLLGTGVLGGFTTLSAYAEESRALLASGHAGLAAAYVTGTVAAGLLAVALADRFSTRRDRAEFEAEEGDL